MGKKKQKYLLRAHDVLTLTSECSASVIRGQPGNDEMRTVAVPFQIWENGSYESGGELE